MKSFVLVCCLSIVAGALSNQSPWHGLQFAAYHNEITLNKTTEDGYSVTLVESGAPAANNQENRVAFSPKSFHFPNGFFNSIFDFFRKVQASPQTHNVTALSTEDLNKTGLWKKNVTIPINLDENAVNVYNCEEIRTYKNNSIFSVSENTCKCFAGLPQTQFMMSNKAIVIIGSDAKKCMTQTNLYKDTSCQVFGLHMKCASSKISITLPNNVSKHFDTYVSFEVMRDVKLSKELLVNVIVDSKYAEANKLFEFMYCKRKGDICNVVNSMLEKENQKVYDYIMGIYELRMIPECTDLPQGFSNYYLLNSPSGRQPLYQGLSVC